MYSLLSELTGQPIISLQTGQIVAWAGQPILEITSLEVIALSCQSPHGKQPLILITRDIRQYAPDCIIVDSEEELADPEDIIRLNANPKDHYSPLGKPVLTDSGTKLGIVSDYSLNLETNRVQKLHVRKPLLQGWLGSMLIIDRTQILDVTPERITVRDSTITSPLLSPDSLPEI